MKKAALFIILITSAVCFCQTSDYTGMWQIVVKRSAGKNYTTPTEYVELKSDNTYLWGIDSSKTNPLDGVSKGTWAVTDDGGIKMIPDPNPANEATYYRKSEDGKLTWDGHEMNGVKEKVMLEISIYLQKIK